MRGGTPADEGHQRPLSPGPEGALAHTLSSLRPSGFFSAFPPPHGQPPPPPPGPLNGETRRVQMSGRGAAPRYLRLVLVLVLVRIGSISPEPVSKTVKQSVFG